MAEERDKCQIMVDQIRREIEAQATEVSWATLQCTVSNFKVPPMNNIFACRSVST